MLATPTKTQAHDRNLKNKQATLKITLTIQSKIDKLCRNPKEAEKDKPVVWIGIAETSIRNTEEA